MNRIKPKPSSTDKFIGERIRIIRMEKGKSQSELAKALNISSQQIQKYERGINRISASRLFELSFFLEVSIYDFIPFEAQPVSPSMLARISEEIEGLIKAIYSINFSDNLNYPKKITDAMEGAVIFEDFMNKNFECKCE